MHQTTGTEWSQVKATFKQIWGYDDFRFPQGEIVQCLLSGQDSLIVMPTGGGKSICFQLPALMQTGLTLVVSPLVALMENQVQELRSRNLPASLLHSQLPAHQRKHILAQLEQQRLRLLYLSPETLLSEPVWTRLCNPVLKLNGLILDEAHCLVQWGDTFRPAYRRLGAIRPALLQHRPGATFSVAAFTATADPQAQQIIREVLQLENPQTFLLNPYRSNLALAMQTVWTPRGRRQQALKFVQQHKGSGLIYVRTRRDGEELAEWFRQKGYSVAAYHAGLGANERRSLEDQWIKGKLQFVTCTSAFGMGINKPDCRWVLHFHAPSLLSEYVQEVGRGGRDGKPAVALTLISEPTGWLDPDDKQRSQFFQNQWRSQQATAQKLIHALPTEGDVNTVSKQFKEGAIALALLHSSGQLHWKDPFHYVLNRSSKVAPNPLDEGVRQMTGLLRTKQCRWKYLLEGFGFGKEAVGFQCGKCDRCRSAMK